MRKLSVKLLSEPDGRPLLHKAVCILSSPSEYLALAPNLAYNGEPLGSFSIASRNKGIGGAP